MDPTSTSITMQHAAKTTIRINTELLKKAQHRSIDEEITFQELIDRAVRDYLKKPLERMGAQK